MPFYKSGLDMFRKYQAKYNPTVIGTRFTDVQAIALERAQEGLNALGAVRDLVRPILDERGISGTLRAAYLAFAAKVWRHVMRSKGDAGKKIVDGLKAYFVTGYGLDPAVCDEIISVVAGYVIAY